MNRRELIKAIIPTALVPTLTINGVTKAAAVAVPKGYYMLFVDPCACDIEGMAATSLPDVAKDVVVDIFPMKLRQGQSIQDVIALYKLDEPKEAI